MTIIELLHCAYPYDVAEVYRIDKETGFYGKKPLVDWEWEDDVKEWVVVNPAASAMITGFVSDFFYEPEYKILMIGV